MTRFLLLPLLAAVSGCGGFRNCEDLDTSGARALPSLLSETGLFADLLADEVVAEAELFEPRFELWSDGATKRRWLLLPAGEVVDTSDDDRWDFPIGTRLFKEFTRDGVRVETRLIERLDVDRWGAVAYRWEPNGSDAVAIPEGDDDARGTSHDIPDAASCIACHGGRASFVLGYSAVQLDDVALPGDDLDHEALGYLHANCSHCHNADRHDDEVGCYDPGELDFTLPADGTSVSSSPAIRTAGRGLTGNGRNSEVLWRMSHRNTSALRPSMPPVATERVDQDAVDLITEWIGQL